TKFARIHVRANSNDEFDQQLKMEVKEEIVNFLSPMLSQAQSVEKSKEIIRNNILEIEQVANDYLKSKNSLQNATVKFQNEYFPTRLYGETLVEGGNYDAVIIEIGQAEGDNWWCVVYPPLCFIGGRETDSQTLIYKSKLKEIFERK
ncbi:MAG: stage II sporulation protein R, partial [Clostridia bacterium]